jgi:hypothetical protein
MAAKYVPTQAELKQLNTSFSYHPPHGDQAERYINLRDSGRQLAEMVLESCPASREKSLALTKIEEAVMWANASIARNEGTP